VWRDRKRVVSILWFVALLFVAFGVLGQEANDEASYEIHLDGRKTWTLRYGFGDALGLATSGLAPGQLELDQSLSADIHGEALSILSVEAHFDDRQPDALQSMAIRLDTDRLDGVVGDFVAEGFGGFAAYGKKMTGLELEYTIGNAVLTGVASRLEGVSETKTYVGEKASAEVIFSAFTATDPPRAQAYKRAIDGLYAYPLTVFYVEEFTDVALTFDAGDGLRGVLTEYGLSYLIDALLDGNPYAFEEWEFQIVGTEEQILLLLEDGLDLVRDRLEAAIDRYNEIIDSDDEEEYPFSRGTASDLAFLEAVAGFVSVTVDEEAHPILDATRRRFFDLGRDGIVESSLVVEVSDDGDYYETVGREWLEEYDVELYAEGGILEVDFPAAFFTDRSAIRARFDYTVTGGVFMLGLSIIPGSERVSINEQVLVRDEGYLIDYEIGMLVLLIEIEQTDVVQVEFERFAGGIFGVAADYATYFYGLVLDWPVSEGLSIEASLLQSAEDPGSVSDPDAVETMPNRHTVAGISGRLVLDGFSADAVVMYSNDRFPFDSNGRINKPNAIAAIVADGGVVYFGHRNGLTIARGDTWLAYGTSEGLPGRSVQALAVGDDMLFVGTGSGLSVVRLNGVSPLDRVANWTSYYAGDDDGLPDSSVNALFFAEGVLWVGTDDGLVSMDLVTIDDLTTWRRPDQEVDLGEVTALIGDDDALFVGTGEGLFELSLRTGLWQKLPGSEGTRIYDLNLSDGTLYVASDRGLRTYRDGIGTGWLVLGEAVRAVESFEERVLYGTPHGLFGADRGDALLGDVDITALAAAADVLWIGSEADAEYVLTVRSYGDTVTEYRGDVTGIDGRDPFAFVDAAAADHTIEGFVERVSFRRATPEFTLSGRVENVSPAYRAIGRTGRSDSTGWDLAATWSISDDADLSISHAVGIVGARTGDRSMDTDNDISLQWTFGPVLTAGASYSSVNDDAAYEGPEATDASLRFNLSDQFFEDRLMLGISWSDGIHWTAPGAYMRRQTSLSLNADAMILASWTANLNWSRPVLSNLDEWSGSERLTLGTEWESRVGETSDLGVEYTLDWSRSIPAGNGQREHELDVDLDVDPIEASEWRITPGVTLRASTDESSADVTGQVNGRVQRGDLSIQGSLRAGLTGLWGTVVRESDRLSVTVGYTGIESLHPTLTYSVDRQAALYQTQRQTSMSHSLRGRASWTMGDIQQDILSVSLTSKGSGEDRTLTARVENTYRLSLQEWIGAARMDEPGVAGSPAIDLSIDTDLNVRISGTGYDLDASTSGRLNAALSPMWSGSFGMSYFGGADSDETEYGSLLLDLTIAIDF